MLENARSALLLFGFSGGLALICAAAGCSSAPAPAGAPFSASAAAAVSPVGDLPMSSLEPPARTPKHCCLVLATDSSSGGSVEVFHNAKPFGHVGTVKYPTQNPHPQAAIVSASGVVYVADLGTETVYAFGNGYLKAPTASFPQTNPSGVAVPRSIALGGDGTLYVSDELDSGSVFIGNVVHAYPSGSSQPYTLQGPPNAIDDAGVAVDPDNNVYIAADAVLPSNPSQQVVQVIEYAPGSPSGQVRNLIAPPDFGKAVAVDAVGNLLIGDLNASCGAVYVFPPGQTTPSKIIGTACSSGSQVSALVLTAHNTLFFADSFNLYVQEYSYPRGRPLGTLFVPNIYSVVGLGEGPARK